MNFFENQIGSHIRKRNFLFEKSLFYVNLLNSFFLITGTRIDNIVLWKAHSKLEMKKKYMICAQKECMFPCCIVSKPHRI